MSDDSEQVGQDEIEKMLQAAQGSDAEPAKPAEPKAEEATVDQAEIEALLNGGSPPAPAATSAPAAPTAATSDSNVNVSQNDIELLMSKAEEAIASINQSDNEASVLPPGIRSFEYEQFSGTAANTESATLELMRDVQLDMTIELGRTHMQLEDVLKLKQGAVVPLDKLAGDPADIYVNGRLVARGEVLVLNDNFCVRVAELIVGDSACA